MLISAVHFFLRLNNIALLENTYHILFIHLSVDHTLALVVAISFSINLDVLYVCSPSLVLCFKIAWAFWFLIHKLCAT